MAALTMALWGSLNANPLAPWWADPTLERVLHVRAYGPLVAGLAAGIGLWRLRDGGRVRPLPAPLLALFAYAAIGLVGTTISAQPLVAATWGALYVSALLVLWLAISLGRLRVLAATTGILLAAIVAYFFLRAVVDLGLIDAIVTGVGGRFYGSRPGDADQGWATANGVSRFAAIGALFVVHRVLVAPRWSTRWAWAPALLILAVLLWATISRSGLFGFGLAFLALVALVRGRRSAFALAGVGLLVLLAPPVMSSVLDYLRRGESLAWILSFSGRTGVWIDAFWYGLKSPAFGWGFHADRIFLGEHVHEAWLHATMQAGVLGLLAFAFAWLWSWGALFQLGLRSRYSAVARPKRDMLVLATVVLLFLTVRSLVESTAAFFGVDLLLLAPLMAFVAMEHEGRPAPPLRPTSERRVLVSAFACRPPASPNFEGGEDLLGWNLVTQIARRHAVWVLTDAKNEPDIALEPSSSRIKWVYVSAPSWLAPLRRVQGFVQWRAYAWQVRAYFAARRLHRHLRFDLVHHLTYANDWMASHVGALLPVAYVRGPGGGAHRVPADLGRARGLRFRAVQALRTTLQRLLRLDPFFRLGQARASALLLCMPESIRELPAAWRIKAELFPVNGIEPAAIASTPAAPSPEGLRVVTAGKLLAIKGFDLALRAFATAVGSTPNAHLVILGDGPERRSLERLANRLGVRERVEFRGWTTRTEVLQEMRRADVFLFPSLRDGGGAVVIEAMAAGLPVICLDVGGPALHVTVETGIKVVPAPPALTVARLAEALRTLAASPPLRLRLGTAGRRRVLDHYAWDAIGERLMQVYQHSWARTTPAHALPVPADAGSVPVGAVPEAA